MKFPPKMPLAIYSKCCFKRARGYGHLGNTGTDVMDLGAQSEIALYRFEALPRATTALRAARQSLDINLPDANGNSERIISSRWALACAQAFS